MPVSVMLAVSSCTMVCVAAGVPLTAGSGSSCTFKQEGNSRRARRGDLLGRPAPSRASDGERGGFRRMAAAAAGGGVAAEVDPLALRARLVVLADPEDVGGSFHSTDSHEVVDGRAWIA